MNDFLDCPECGEPAIPASGYDRQAGGPTWCEDDPEVDCQCGARLTVSIQDDDIGNMHAEAAVVEAP